MTSAQDIIQAALEELGVYAPGEVMTAADSSRGLWSLNSMLDSWSNESLFTYAIQTYSVPLAIGQQQYTVGPSGQVNAVRPIRILDGPGTAYVVDQSQNRYPISVIPQDQWNQIGLLNTNSQIPTMIFYDPQYPLGILNVFPLPSMTYTLYFDAYLQLSEFANLETQLSLPPGYQDAIQHNLAIRLQPYFQRAQISPVVVELASTSKAAIKRSNLRSNVAGFDSAIVSRGTPTYNIFRDARNGS